MDAIRQTSEDFAIMLEWFERTGYNADIVRLPRFFGIPVTSFEDWARKQGRFQG